MANKRAFTALPYCAGCGKELLSTDEFCPRCGRRVSHTADGPHLTAPPEPSPPNEGVFLSGSAGLTAPEAVRGLGRNTIVCLTRDGVQGVEIRSTPSLLLALFVPIPPLVAIYYSIQAGALAVYITAWIAASALLYDELRRQGLKGLEDVCRGPTGGRRSWSIPWRSVQMADWNGRTLWFASASPRRKLSVTFDRDDAPLVEGTLESQGVRYAWKAPRLPQALTRFSTLVLLLFVIGQVIMVLAATAPFFPGEEQAYATIYSNTQNQITGATFLGEFRDIFLNNVQVALGSALPFLGTLSYGLASYNTGRVIQIIAIKGQVPPAAVLVALYVLPHTWVEESAYPVATMAGILAFTKWRAVSPHEFSRRVNWGSTKLAIALGGAAAILVAAGFIETLTSYVGSDILALWAVFAILAYSVVRSRRRRRRAPPAGTP